MIPASIKPRIKSTIPIDVRVRIDARGHVVSATLPDKHRAGLESYLAERAVEAAKQWKFEPAREDGKAVAGEQTLRFTFGK
jgi:outer membrane biosynthesis protein TonB